MRTDKHKTEINNNLYQINAVSDFRRKGITDFASESSRPTEIENVWSRTSTHPACFHSVVFTIRLPQERHSSPLKNP